MELAKLPELASWVEENRAVELGTDQLAAPATLLELMAWIDEIAKLSVLLKLTSWVEEN